MAKIVKIIQERNCSKGTIGGRQKEHGEREWACPQRMQKCIHPSTIDKFVQLLPEKCIVCVRLRTCFPIAKYKNPLVSSPLSPFSSRFLPAFTPLALRSLSCSPLFLSHLLCRPLHHSTSLQLILRRDSKTDPSRNLLTDSNHGSVLAGKPNQ